MISRFAALGVATLATVAQASEPVDLDNPRNLEAVERDRPAHYAKIQQILADAPRQPTGDVPKWMHAQFDAQDVLYTDLMMTSLPPKKLLRFSLDQSSYVMTITLPDWRNTMPVPLPDRKRP